MLKKIGYALLIVSYFIVAFILVYTNIINPQYDKKIFFVLTILVIIIWLGVPSFLLKLSDNKNKDKPTLILKHVATLPLYLIILPFAIIFATISIAANSFRRKIRSLLKNGFTCKKEKAKKKKIYYLSKENIVIKISEFDLYEISDDGGDTFERIENSKIFSATQREAFKNNLLEYYSCDYRDKELYDPTIKLVEMLNKK